MFLFSGDQLGELAPLPTVQYAASGLRPQAAPLFEKEGHALGCALVANRPHPCLVHRPRLRAALTAHDHPIDTVKVQLADIADRWLDGEEAHTGRRLLKMRDA